MLIPRILTPEQISHPFDELLYITTLDEKYYPTIGVMHSLDIILTDVAPYIRHILRTEHERKPGQPDQLLIGNLFTRVRKTRRQVKEEQEGRKKWFNDKVDSEAALKTWLRNDIPGENDSAESIRLDNGI